MHLTFSLDFDVGAWPGPTPLGGASVGKAWLGPLGLLNTLENQLGLQGPSTTAAERTASALAGVAAQDGFHRRSAESDLFGTARRLLRDRDLLWLHGWRGEGLTPRLEQLAAATGDALPGFPDRLEEVGSALKKRNSSWTPIERLDTLEPISALPLLWREVLDQLARLGTIIEVVQPAPSKAGADLAAARCDRFEPRGDGSLELVRGYGPLQTADDVAAWLAAHAALEETLVIGPDEVLDAALRRHGLPTTGAPSRTNRAACLQIVPLVLEHLLDPPDPRRALELVCLPESPIPPALRRRLRRALREWPAVGSPSWTRAIERHLANLGEKRREELERRLNALLAPRVQHGEPLPVHETRTRIEELARWLRRRTAVAGTEPPLSLAHEQCRILIRLLDVWPKPNLPEAQLRRLVEGATEAISTPPMLPAKAGLEAVGAPGCMAEAARYVVWWSFSREEAGSPVGPRLPPAEVAALRQAGVAVPDRGAEATVLASRWRRPLLLTRDKLMLCCPLRATDGEELYPHPLWDEIEAAIPRKLRGRIVVDRLGQLDRAIPTEPRARSELPTAQRRWKVALSAGSLHRTEESASGMIALVRCPFAWTCRYPGRLEEAAATYRVMADDRVIGSLAHRLLRQVLAAEPEDGEAAAALAERLFREEGPRLAADLFIPGAATEQADTRILLTRAASALVKWLRSQDLSIEGLEVTRKATVGPHQLHGRLDLVLGPEPAVVDLKLRSRRRYTEELEHGSACQLAVYARLLQPSGASFPAVGYFILATRQLLSPQLAPIPGSQTIAGDHPATTWTALANAYSRKLARIDAGKIDAAGIPGEDGETPPNKDFMREGELTLAPSCDYCRFGGVCGRSIDALP